MGKGKEKAEIARKREKEERGKEEKRGEKEALPVALT